MVQCVSKGSMYSQVPDCRTHRTAWQILSAVTGSSLLVICSQIKLRFCSGRKSSLTGRVQWMPFPLSFHCEQLLARYLRISWEKDTLQWIPEFPMESLEPWQLWSFPDVPKLAENTEQHCFPPWGSSHSLSGILTALGNRMNKMFCPTAWTKNGYLSKHVKGKAEKAKENWTIKPE